MIYFDKQAEIHKSLLIFCTKIYQNIQDYQFIAIQEKFCTYLKENIHEINFILKNTTNIEYRKNAIDKQQILARLKYSYEISSQLVSITRFFEEFHTINNFILEKIQNLLKYLEEKQKMIQEYYLSLAIKELETFYSSEIRNTLERASNKKWNETHQK